MRIWRQECLAKRERFLGRPLGAKQLQLCNGFLDARAMALAYPPEHHVGLTHALEPLLAATHDLDVAEGLLSRAIYLKDGRMVGTDTESRGLADRYRRAIQ